MKHREKQKRKPAQTSPPSRGASAVRAVSPDPAGRPRRSRQQEQQIQKNVRRHKKRRRRNYTLHFILLGFLLVLTGVILSLTVFFKIEVIELTGNGSLPAQEIIDATGIHTGDNLFRIGKSRAEKKILKQFTAIDSVTIRRKLPDTLQIEVTPAKTAAVVRFEGNYYSVSWGGKVVGIAQENPDTSLPEVIGCDFTDVATGDILLEEGPHGWDTLLTVLTGIRENGMEGITYIDIRELSILKLYYQNRIEMKFGGLTDFSFELGRVKQLIEKNVGEDEIASIDATLHNGEYYKRRLTELPLPVGDAASDTSDPADSSDVTASDGGSSSGTSSSDAGAASSGTAASE